MKFSKEIDDRMKLVAGRRYKFVCEEGANSFNTDGEFIEITVDGWLAIKHPDGKKRLMRMDKIVSIVEK